MGGVVSTGRDNDDLVDNLKEAKYIKSEDVETVFRIVDRAHYYLPECRETAYKDLAWKSGTLHLSAPCIYSEVMEALDLEKGLSFLNLGSGTGYLNTMVGFMIGPNGINHGIELHATNVSFAEQRLMEFKESSPQFDDLELCEPVFVTGNCLNLAPDNRRYDRVYCGAACPSELIGFVQNMIKIKGILVVPVGDQLLKIKRISETDFTSENVLPVSFASLVEPSAPKDIQEMIMLAEVNPMSLQDMCRITIRESIRSTFTFEKRPPKTPDTSTKQNKLLHPSRVFRQERGRYPLNILPTNQGLMIMGAFSDDSEASDESEQLDDGFLDQQLQEHALVRRQSTELNPAEVDSYVSDDDEKSESDGGKSDNDEEKNESDKTTDDTKKEEELVGYLRSARQKFESMQSEDGVVADDEDDDEMEMKEMPSVKESEDEELEGMIATSRKKRDGKFSGIIATRNVTVNGKTNKVKYPMLIKRTWVETRELPKPSENQHSLSSDDEVIVAESNVNSSPAIEMNVLDSTARNTKTSYSTSAETSETSGFGSLGDDQIHIGSLHSGLGNMEDDVIEDKSDRSSSSVPTRPNKSTGESSLWSNFGANAASESDDDDSDSEENDDEDDYVEESWMDIEDDVCVSHIGHGNRNVSQSVIANADKGKEKEEGEEASPPTLPPSGFTVFLKKQADTLPLPNTMKSYICHFR